MQAQEDGRARQAQAWAAAELGSKEVAMEPAAADASDRRYFRIWAPTGASRIVMDAPDQREALEAFCRIDGLLRSAGLHVPAIESADLGRGFLLLTDLGQTSYLDTLLGGADPEPLLRAAADALVQWQASSRPGELPPYDHKRLWAELHLFTDWYLPFCSGISATEARRRLSQPLRALVARMERQDRVFVHRDYMPRNLMVCDPLPGVLDFQDAVYGPVTYDPVCLVRDAYISWPRELEVSVLRHYWEAARAAGVPVPASFGDFWAALQETSVHRHLKVLGVFARLYYRDGKVGYLADAPRFFAYLRAAAAEEPAVKPLVQQVLSLAGEPVEAAEGGGGMRAMILAAGRGERMRPLTDKTPKPLLRVGGRALIDWHMERLAQAGVDTVIINTAWLGEQIEERVGDGAPWGIEVLYSREPPGALDTGGGILRALPLLGDDPFWVVSADVWTDYPFARLPRRLYGLAHLVLTDSPQHNPDGDFRMDAAGRVRAEEGARWTFTGIGVFHPALWQDCEPGAFPLATLLHDAVRRGAVSGEHWNGMWADVGTPERLAALRDRVESSPRAVGKGSSGSQR